MFYAFHVIARHYTVFKEQRISIVLRLSRESLSRFCYSSVTLSMSTLVYYLHPSISPCSSSIGKSWWRIHKTQTPTTATTDPDNVSADYSASRPPTPTSAAPSAPSSAPSFPRRGPPASSPPIHLACLGRRLRA